MEIEPALRGRRKRAVAATLTIALCLLNATSTTASAPPGVADELSVEVRQASCPRLDVARLRSLYALEMRGIVDRLGPLTITIACSPEETRLRVDRRTGESAERSIPANFVSRDAEHLLALAGAQLVFATWLEEPATAPAPSVTAASEPRAPHAGSISTAPSARPVTTVDVGLEGGGRAHFLGNVAAGPAARVLVSAWRHRWGAELAMGVDRTTVTRPLGTAQLTESELALSVALRSSYRERLSAEVSVGPAIAILDLRGVEPATGVSTGSLTGFSLGGEASVGARYRAAGFWALARLEGGYLLSRLVGTITGDSSITAAGPWVGAELGAGGAW